jgi:hypothetical protein
MKEQLAQLIEAYAAAKASGNPTLQQFATQQLSTFLGQIDVIEAQPTAEDTDGGEG